MAVEYIYLDYNATTPVHPEVAAAMQPFLTQHFGNPSSTHWFGLQTRQAIESARKQVAALLKCEVDEIIFTSGGSESDNFAIAGYAQKHRQRGNHIVTSQIEHPAVLEVCRSLEQQGFEVTYLPVDKYGMVSTADFRKALKSTTLIASIMQANNEVGTIQPIRELADIAHEHGVVFHTDSAQAVGKIPVDQESLGVDMITIAGHKLYAPKGVGALYIRRGIELQRLIYGAAHERNLRAGTENVLEIVGLGKACEVVGRDLMEKSQQLKSLRDKLERELVENLPQARVNGDPEKRLPNTLSISFPGIEAETIMAELETVACSPGAACHSDQVIMSHVLEAMGVPVEYAMGTIRFSVGAMTTEAEVEAAARTIVTTMRRLFPEGDGEVAVTVPEDGEEVRLTRYTHGLGCACKLRPQALEKVLQSLPAVDRADVLVGADSSDDAAVYRLTDDIAIVQTVDFFTPIVDDPYQFGAIAAANSLSDIYAMGAKPLFALNIVGFPSNRLPMSVLQRILQGATDKATEAGVVIIGGHTVDDTEPKFGLAVSGIVHPEKILHNNSARAGDALVLTKPIGLGIVSTALKRRIAGQEIAQRAYEIMSALNSTAAGVLERFDVSACTDVTGFGLLGHLREMTVGSRVNATIKSDSVPIIPAAIDFIQAGTIPGGTENNLEYVSPSVSWDTSISRNQKYLLADAQTSGGLLITVAPGEAAELVAQLHAAGVADAAVIGEMTSEGDGKIFVS